MRLQRSELLMALEIEFKVAIPKVDWMSIRTPNDLIQMVWACLSEQNRDLPNRESVARTVKQLIGAGSMDESQYNEDEDMFDAGWIE